MKVNKIGFEFYFNDFCNGRQGMIPAESFERSVILATGELEKYISDSAFVGDYGSEIDMCLCELAEYIYQKEKVGNIRSESVDGYSVSFVEGVGNRTNVAEIILRRLGKSGLLYAGVE